ncbi:MAG: hypothetical protein DRR19_32690 [Candidatus Parabeggiatoa sp. nov. 1]|nr:MAG: hypothetical protein DRR19_32690 [Gammaproteobacteria bacterium]
MNTQFETFFVKALYDAKIEELVNTYQEKDFVANKHVKMDEVEFDVIVKQGEKTIAFEIRVLPLSRTEMSDIDKHHEKAKALGYDFRLITIAKPKKSSIEIAWLDKALLEYVANHPIALPQSIVTPLDYQEIETDLKSIQITDSEARVSLNGNLSVHLQYRSDKEREDNEQTFISEKLPFQGKLSLNLSEHQINEAFLSVDNRYWYNESSTGPINSA